MLELQQYQQLRGVGGQPVAAAGAQDKPQVGRKCCSSLNTHSGPSERLLQWPKRSPDNGEVAMPEIDGRRCLTSTLSCPAAGGHIPASHLCGSQTASIRCL